MGTYNDAYEKARAQGKNSSQAEAAASHAVKVARNERMSNRRDVKKATVYAANKAKAAAATMAAKTNKKIASAASEQRRILATYGPDHPSVKAPARKAAPLPPGLTTIKSGIVSKPPDAAVAAASASSSAKLAAMYAANKAKAAASVDPHMGADPAAPGLKWGRNDWAEDTAAITTQGKVQSKVEAEMRKQETAAAKGKNPADPVKAIATQKKVAPDMSATVRNIDTSIRENFYDADDRETHNMGAKDLPPDRVKKALADARKHGEDRVTVKIPSHSEVTLGVKEAAALDAHNDGLTQKQFEQREASVKTPSANKVARANMERDIRESVNPWDVKTPGPDRDIDRAQKDLERAKTPYERSRAQADLNNAHDARDRAREDGTERIVRGEMRDFDKAHAEQDEIDENKRDNATHRDDDGAPKPKRVMSEKQKSSLAKAHEAVREKAKQKKAMAAASGGMAGGSLDEQPRVPGGNPKGGQFANKG